MPGAATGHLPMAVSTASFSSTLPLNALSCWELPLSSGSLLRLTLSRVLCAWTSELLDLVSWRKPPHMTGIRQNWVQIAL